MRIALIVLFLTATPALAGEPNFHERNGSTLLRYNPLPVAYAYHNGDRVPCYSTVREEPDLSGHLAKFYYAYECVEPAHSMSAIGISADSSVINMGNAREATSVRILPNGRIKLE